MSTEATLGSSTTKKQSFDVAFKLKVVEHKMRFSSKTQTNSQLRFTSLPNSVSYCQLIHTVIQYVSFLLSFLSKIRPHACQGCVHARILNKVWLLIIYIIICWLCIITHPRFVFTCSAQLKLKVIAEITQGNTYYIAINFIIH